jgi:hypothetical protein
MTNDEQTGLGTWDRRPFGHPDRERQCPFCKVVYVDQMMARDCRCYRPMNLNEVTGLSDAEAVTFSGPSWETQ